MTKSKWQKKYEQAMETIEMAIQIKEEKLEMYSDIQTLYNLAYAEKTQLELVLHEMKHIAEP